MHSPISGSPFVDVNGLNVCWITCGRSAVPIFCKAKGQSEEFFVRLGPSTAALGPRDLINYQKSRFQ